MYALSDSEISNTLSGAICLSTPFLNFHRRDLGEAFALLTGIPYILTIFLLAFYFKLSISSLYTLLIAGLLGFPFVYISRVVKRWSESADALLTHLPGPCNAPDKVLLMHARGDEASAWLTVAYAFARAQLWFWKKIEKVRSYFSKKLSKPLNRRRTFLLCVLFFVPSFWGMHARLPYSLNELLFVCAGVASLFCAQRAYLKMPMMTLIAISGALPWIFYPVCCLLMGGAFGRDLARYSFFLDVTAEVSPPGRWNFVIPEALAEATKELQNTTLAHSLYDHPESPRIIAEWILQSVA